MASVTFPFHSPPNWPKEITALRLVYLLFASFKNFYVLTGIQTKDFQFGKEPESSDVKNIDTYR